LTVFVILFLVHLRFPSSFFVRPFLVPIWVLVWMVRSIMRCFSHILPCTFFCFFPYFFVILLFRLSFFVSLHCHRMCSSVSCALQNGQSGSRVPSILLRCVARGPTVTNSQSGYRLLMAPFQLFSVILPTRVLLSLFHCILHHLPTFFCRLQSFPS
jgi:hypothetical protein